MSLETPRMLILSTFHITPASLEKLEGMETVWKNEYGAMVSTSQNIPEAWESMPDVRNVRAFAASHGCEFVMWDRDGPEIAELLRYDWGE